MDPYGFQTVALRKLAPMKNRFIADDMGLGKTVQGIWLDQMNRREWVKKAGPTRFKTLIIAPLAVHDSWERHITELTGAPVVRIDPKARNDFYQSLTQPVNGFYIVHWQALRFMTQQLKKVNWFHIIADEAHRAKNRKTQQTQALKQLQSYYKTALSGSPADKPDDLWSIFHWLWPKDYRSYWNFRKRYCEEGQVDLPAHKLPPSGRAPTKIVGVKNVEELHAEIEPWFIRRLKHDVLDDLPEKTYSEIYVELHPKQRIAYNQMKRDMIAWLDDQDDIVPMMAPVVIAQLVRLQQFALGYMQPHPTKEGKWIMSDPSAKLDVLCELIADHPTEQFVVFSQSKAILYLLAQRLDRMKTTYGLYTGDQKPSDKDALEHNFQAGNVQVFAGTIAAGGEGITLTAASTVVFLDRMWNPFRNTQAEDRLHRIGQKNAVQVIDLLARNTVDPDRKYKIELKKQTLITLLGDHR